MGIENTKMILPLAVVFLTVSLLLERIVAEGSRLGNFFGGLCLGLAFSLSVFVCIRTLVADRHE